MTPAGGSRHFHRSILHDLVLVAVADVTMHRTGTANESARE
jgi:hypothetical protein